MKVKKYFSFIFTNTRHTGSTSDGDEHSIPSRNNISKSLNSGQAQTFSQDTLKDTTAEVRESCYDVSKTAMELEKDRNERLRRKAEEEKCRREEGMEAEPVKRKKPTTSKEQSEGDELGEKDEDYIPDDESKPVTKKARKTSSLQSLIAPDTKEYRTTAADRLERRKQRSGDDTELPDSTEQPEETEEEKRKKELEHQIDEHQKELKRMEK